MVVNNVDLSLASTDVSTVIVATRGGVVAERTMMWDARDGSKYGGHAGKAVGNPSTEWYLAEGEANFFQTFILLANPGDTAATATVTFLFDDGTTVVRSYRVEANTRFTVWTNAVPGVTGRSFSAKVNSTQPIIVERAMYFTTDGQAWTGGTASAAVASPSTTWFVAEGATGDFFDEYLLLANPNPTAATATIRFLRSDGAVFTHTVPLLPTSRRTVQVDMIPGLEWAEVSAEVTATQPIIVERSMYWPRWPWKEGHNSVGMTSLGTRWALAEGEQGGALRSATYILLANPGSNAATATVTLLRENGAPPLVRTVAVPGHARVTVDAGTLGLSDGERFGALIEATQAIAVERAMYWNGGGVFWGAGSNETATPLKSGPPFAVAGRLTDATSGAGIANARVELRDASTGLVSSAQTDNTGAYRMTLMTTGTFTVYLIAPGYQSITRTVTTAASATLNLLDVGLTATPVGFPVLQCAPIASGSLTVTVTNRFSASIQVAFSGPTTTSMTLGIGATQATTLSPGQYQITATAANAVPAAGTFSLTNGCGYSLTIDKLEPTPPTTPPSPPPTPNPPPPASYTMRWSIKNTCSVTQNLKFYDRSNSLVYPSSTTHYTISSGDTRTFNLSCRADAKICAGGSSSANGSGANWGVGLFGKQGCADCCYFCVANAATIARQITCTTITSATP